MQVQQVDKLKRTIQEMPNQEAASGTGLGSIQANMTSLEVELSDERKRVDEAEERLAGCRPRTSNTHNKTKHRAMHR